jgi:UDP-N-acetylmuramate--alanine ligase
MKFSSENQPMCNKNLLQEYCLPQNGNSAASGTQLVVTSAAVEDSVPDIITANKCKFNIEVVALISQTKELPAGTSGKSTTALLWYFIY